jgi:hypothetical protein
MPPPELEAGDVWSGAPKSSDTTPPRDEDPPLLHAMVVLVSVLLAPAVSSHFQKAWWIAG